MKLRPLFDFLNNHLDKIAHFGVAVCVILIFDKFGLKSTGVVIVILLMLFKEWSDSQYTYWDWYDVLWTVLGILFYLIFAK